MSKIAKTLVATGCSSGLGFELIKQLLAQSQPYKFILGARDTKGVSASFSALNYDSKTHDLSIFPLELSDMKTVKTFAAQTLEKLGKGKVDCLLLNAGMVKGDDGTSPGAHGSKWTEQYIVNCLCKASHLMLQEFVHKAKSNLDLQHNTT
jgi:NADP-dependent 3-hydroxy acid dehydrogenase YdfG